MTTAAFTPSRRVLLSAALSLGLLAIPAGLLAAEQGEGGKVDVTELMAPNALPDIVEGKASAPVTIVEYASMTCGHCAAFHREIYPVIKKDYIETGKVKFILREFPLDEVATAAFMLARSLGPDKRDAAVDLLFAQQKNWAFTDSPLDGLASVLKQTGIGQSRLEEVLKDTKLQQDVNAVRDRAAEKFEIRATPTFFINGVKFTGEMKTADLDKIIAETAKASAPEKK
ncbi:MAG TPA: thioredoxin domain-containing protein [Methylocystis sp.]|nr:thioredoxin domain-containing protein [Methylocystis sp.]